MGSGSYLNENFVIFLAFVVPSGECARKTCGRKIAVFSVPMDGNLATCRLFSVRKDGK